MIKIWCRSYLNSLVVFPTFFNLSNKEFMIWATTSLFLFHLLILSGVISPHFSNSILGTYQSREFIFQCHILNIQSWIFIGRTDAEAETAILCPPDAKNWLIGKDLDARKHWRHEEKGMIEDEMTGWHRQFNEHESEHAPGVCDE